jgi:hypothetical protein
VSWKIWIVDKKSQPALILVLEFADRGSSGVRPTITSKCPEIDVGKLEAFPSPKRTCHFFKALNSLLIAGF